MGSRVAGLAGVGAMKNPAEQRDPTDGATGA